MRGPYYLQIVYLLVFLRAVLDFFACAFDIFACTCNGIATGGEDGDAAQCSQGKDDFFHLNSPDWMIEWAR